MWSHFYSLLAHSRPYDQDCDQICPSFACLEYNINWIANAFLLKVYQTFPRGSRDGGILCTLIDRDGAILQPLSKIFYLLG